jgi:hypothetical protein
MRRTTQEWFQDTSRVIKILHREILEEQRIKYNKLGVKDIA